jgi:hypothetical protein
MCSGFSSEGRKEDAFWNGLSMRIFGSTFFRESRDDCRDIGGESSRNFVEK